MGTKKTRRRRTGYVREMRSGVWEVSVNLGRDVRGSREEAEEALGRLVKQCRAGQVANVETTMLAEFVEHWRTAILPAQDRVRPRTANGYLDHLRRYILPQLGTKRVRAITPRDIERLVRGLQTERGLSGVTIRNVMTALRSVLREARRLGLADSNPLANVPLPSTKPRELPTWSASEGRKFLAAARTSRWGAAWRVLVVLGLRPSKLRGLAWDDLDFNEKTLTVRRATTWDREGHCWSTTAPKTDRSGRTLPLDTKTVETLAAHRTSQARDRLREGGSWGECAVGCAVVGPVLKQ